MHVGYLLKNLCESNTLTPYMLFRQLQHYRPVKNGVHIVGQWETYTYVDAKYDFMENNEKKSIHNHVESSTNTCLPSKSHKLQTEKIKRCKQIIQNGIKRLGQLDHYLNATIILQIYKEHISRMHTSFPIDQHNMQKHKQCYMSLSSNLKRVIKSRAECSVPRLMFSPKLYKTIFDKDCVLKV